MAARGKAQLLFVRIDALYLDVTVEGHGGGTDFRFHRALVVTVINGLGDLRAQLDMRLSMYHAMIVAAVEKRSQQAMKRLREMETDREAWASDEERRASYEQSSSQLEAQAEKLSALRRELSDTISVWNARCETNALTMPSRGE